MSSTLIKDDQYAILSERNDLMAMQEKILIQMTRQNELMNQKVSAEIAKTEEIRQQTEVMKQQIVADIALTEVKRQENALQEEKNRIDAENAKTVQQLFLRLQDMISVQEKGFPKLLEALNFLHKKMDVLLDFQRLIIPRILKDGAGDMEIARLTEVLKAFGRANDFHFGGQTFSGDFAARDVTLADGASTIKQTQSHSAL